MTISDERLREAYDELVARRAPADRSRCPPPEALRALVERDGTEAARVATLDHVIACSACRPELDLLRAATAAASATTESGRLSQRVTPRTLGLAAALLIAAGIGVVVRERADHASPQFRQAGRLELLPPSWLASGDALLAWRPLAGAARYRLEVYNDLGQTFAEATLADTSFVLPGSVALAAPTLVWSVSAILPDGSELEPASRPLARPAPR